MRIAALFAVALFSGAAYAGSCTDPANFSPKQRIETKFADFVPGQVAVYSDGEDQAKVSVLPHYIKSGGIWWLVISDIGGELDSLILGEGTFDLYAENKSGDVCYGGEITSAFEHHPENDSLVEISGEGSFVHGLDGERAGTYMVANPTLNQTWTIESIDGGNLSEEARVTAVTATLVTLEIRHFENGALVEVEKKTFDGRGEKTASVTGEPTSTRKSITSL